MQMLHLGYSKLSKKRKLCLLAVEFCKCEGTGKNK